MPLKTKLVIWLISFTLLPLVMFGAIIFSQTRSILESVRLAQLNNIADLKKVRIETFFIERTGDIKSAQNFLTIKRNLPVVSAPERGRAHTAYAGALKELNDQLRPFQREYGYLDIMLTDRKGRVVYSSEEKHKLTDQGISLPDSRIFEEGKKGVYFTDVLTNKVPGDAGNPYEIFCVAPLTDINGYFMGELIIEIDMAPIYKFIRETTGLGRTGEALITRKDGDSVLFLSPINDDPDAALKKKVPMDDKLGYAAQKAALGQTGSGITTDYRGTEVLAAWRYIPSLRWGLVTKINAAEAFAPVRTLQVIMLSLGLFMIIAGIFASVAIAGTITRPILILQQGAEAVAAGDLSKRVGTNARDEIGRLGQSFDAMTEALQRDISGREKAEEEVRELNKDLEHHVRQLEESNKELEAFSYSVSHDLRSPLRSIDGFSRALVEDYGGKFDEEGRDFLERIRGATQRMAQLIDDLLKLSRVARMEANRETVDLSAIVADIAGRLRKNHPERLVQFVIAEGLAASGDERLLTVVLENIVANAWKFSEKQPKAVIEFGVTSVQGEPAYFVKDNGAGFDMAFADKLFNPFQRLHHAAEYSGTGIGLATVKRIINRHGGRVWIEGEVDKGTTVFFTLG
jgi:signal transduction histidine kinase